MNKRVFKILEFDKILGMVSSYAVMETSANEILSSEVSDSIKKVNRMQEETADAILSPNATQWKC